MPINVNPRIIYSGKHYLIANKPHGVYCQPPDLRTWFKDNMKSPLVLLDILRTGNPDCESSNWRSVHRIDSDVTGGVLIAKSKASAANFSRNLRKGGNYGYTMVRKYVALVSGSSTIKDNDGVMSFAGMTTYYKKVDEHCVVLQLCTGKKHQIRKQLAQGLGQPILNDTKYGGIKVEGVGHQIALHSAFIKTRVGMHEHQHMIPIIEGSHVLWSQYIDANLHFRPNIQELLAQDWSQVA